MAARDNIIIGNSKSKTTANPKNAKAKSTIQLFTPSPEQQSIIDAIAGGRHVAVNAVAGSGKTTTILGLASQCPDKKIIQITYNRALKLEVEKKAAAHHLKNLKILTYHGLACSFYDYTARTDERITDILTKAAPLNPLSKSKDALAYDIVIIDEVQDMTPLYFELVHKWLRDIRRSVVLGIMGDHLQGIYGFKGADERFLTLGEAIFSEYQPMMRMTLNTSYRLTRPMATFVNQVLLGGQPRINAIKEGPVVSWVQYPKRKNASGVSHLTKYISELIISKLSVSASAPGIDAKEKLEPDDIFILAPSIKSRGAESIRDLENALVSAGILCFVPISEEAKLDERIIKGKVVFTTMHQSKGRERKFVIVYGFDSSYYDIFKCQDTTASEKVCPNLLYVAATRASQELILVEHLDTHYPLPFLGINHSQMSATNYISVKRHFLLDNSNKLDKILPLKSKLKDGEEGNPDARNTKPPSKSVSDLIKFIDERTLAMLTNMLEQVFTIQTPESLETTIEIPSDVKTGTRTYEQVSDINGITIPALLFCSSKSKSTQTSDELMKDRRNYLWRYVKYRFYKDTTNDMRYSFIKSYTDKIKATGLSSVDMWLMLGNIFICANDGYNYKLKQITKYDWLTQEMIDICHKNIQMNISQEVANVSMFEMELGCAYDGASAFYLLDHPIYGKLQLRGRIDCITPDTIWEFKCVESLTLESMLQLVIYAWIWKRLVIEYNERKERIARREEAELKSTSISTSISMLVDNEMAGYDAYLEGAHRTTRDDLFYLRECKLLNIRTGEVRLLDTSSNLLDEIMETVLAAKLRITKPKTDEEFINDSREMIKKYISKDLDLHLEDNIDSTNNIFEDVLENIQDNDFYEMDYEMDYEIENIYLEDLDNNEIEIKIKQEQEVIELDF